MEIGQLMDGIVEVTKEGRIQDWVERIADIAREAGLPLETISWQGPPQFVALHVVETAKRRGQLEAIERIIVGRKGS